MPKKIGFLLVMLWGFLAFDRSLGAQTADQAWLKYAYVHTPSPVPFRVRALADGLVEKSAARELERGIESLYGLSSNARPDGVSGSIVLGTAAEVRMAYPKIQVPNDIGSEGFWMNRSDDGGNLLLVIVGGGQRGVLYGAFALLRRLAQALGAPNSSVQDAPAVPIRWVDEWDNADGSIERGYAGRSIFFEGGKVRDDLAPVAEYARLLASVGVNGCNLNNVNGSSPFLVPEMLRDVARIADAMRPWGVRVALSVDIASPQKVGGLATYDPLDPTVKEWWNTKVDEIYGLIPDFAGFTVKADSEGQPGPASYGRTPADAANTLAAALAPHGGAVLYRAFVYNHHLDWRDPKADRARAAYDIFHPLDGKFAPNVIVQIKYGPIDFQVREPVSPLFGGLIRTDEAMELQITQEYTGQQRHLVYLAPLWKEVLDFDLRVGGKATPVKSIIAGDLQTENRRSITGHEHRPVTGGLVGVANVGRDRWLGSPLAMANLYAFGRLAWDPDLSPGQIAEEWTRQSISADTTVVRTVTKMLLQSWPAYESYTGPLGLQTLTNILGSHYGPGIESSENNGWGQWHRADHKGVGMDRTVATGTGFVGQYAPEVAKTYESAATTPDNLLLFFHHAPYTYKLHDGKTVIQYLYDSHYEGAAQAAEFVPEWDSLKGRIDPLLYSDVRARLEYQAGHAVVWRDAVVEYLLKLTGIPDRKGRAGNYPNRLEAEDARLSGYRVIDIFPWEDASRGKAVACANANTGVEPRCSAEWTYSGRAGHFDVAVQYFDLENGVAKFEVRVNGQPAGGDSAWAADAKLPWRQPTGDNSTRHFVGGVDLKPGDVIGVEATPDGADPAVLDYIEILPPASQ